LEQVFRSQVRFNDMSFYTNVHMRGNDILVCGYENGKRVKKAVHYQPYLFEPNKVYDSKGVETPYHTLSGEPVHKRVFDSMRDAREYVREFRGVVGKPIYGFTNFQYTFINDMYPGVIDYDPKIISIVTLDIEVSSEGGFPDIETANKVVTAITVRKNGESVVLGLKPYKNKDDSVTYLHCKSEEDLLTKFLAIWQSEQYAPDIVTGWNVEFFDIPYLVNRIRRQLGDSSAKRLSPWGLMDERELEIMGRPHKVFIPIGVTILDYMQAYKKFSFSQQESFKLDHIAFVELGERKLDYSEYDSLHDFYEKDFQGFIDYNIRDVVLVDKLEDKLKFIEQILAIAYDGKVNLIDAFTSVRMWDIIIHNYLLENNIVVPIKDKQDKDGQIVGAYVKDPQIGMHEWVVSFDLNSLYPHLIMQYNISPETIAGELPGLSIESILDGALNDPAIQNKLKEDDVTVAASGIMFTRSKPGFLPTLMEKMYNDRVRYKNQMIEAKKKYELINNEIKRRGLNFS
jgi:DNA polymerase elongation subunit (family B)